jgi:phosphoribosyl-ATP pyrophosphohydrolase
VHVKRFANESLHAHYNITPSEELIGETKDLNFHLQVAQKPPGRQQQALLVLVWF